MLIEGFDDIPEHEFRIEEIYEEFVTGMALSSPFAWEYGEPDIKFVLRVLSQDGNSGSQGTA